MSQNHNAARILIVDDEIASLHAIRRVLRRDYQLLLFRDGQSALEQLRQQKVEVVMADQRMPDMSGVDVLQHARRIQPEAVRILITGYSDIEATIRAINDGQIFYYIHKPWEPEELRLIIRRAVEYHRLQAQNRQLLEELQKANEQLRQENVVLHRELEQEYVFNNIVGQSPAMKRVFHLMKKVIPTDATVLIWGETGTGKELIARAIHFNGPRRNNMFVSQNCAALPDTLLESELFGHVKGAFTGATKDKRGLFEVANGGTIFLDEIGETSPEFQKRLLRVLQDGEIHPVGSEKTIRVNVRIISATNKDLYQAMRDGRFREDLYYRLNVFPIHLPALRERRDDIPLLVQHFIRKYARKMGKRVRGIEPSALEQLMDYDFPGNVRELENMIERAIVLLDDGELITSEYLDIPAHPPALFNNGTEYNRFSLRKKVMELERLLIHQVLAKNMGNVSRAAKELELSRLGLLKKLQRYNIDPKKYKQH